eukprot:gnl/TRDRNA2_/TRDRNA2_128396_c0_seq2.p1 gnl/TRDRNA2_/TRDRNA2_128396_c0~~gnl/TRDRNA2_/TRDRNA2_128396_c0_seq2.p1  ORF type:complete len:139 (+),score=16.41 gnl/TRDRNA2_/TRDRNA2_128396_c0_seq2:111-527(+)
MVIPIPAGVTPQLSGPIPEECNEGMVKVKWAVLAMIVFGIGRVVCVPDLMALLNIFLNVVMGTFLLKNDPHLEGFYKCLAQTICQTCAEQGMGGLSCLMPFIVCTALNCVFDFIYVVYQHANSLVHAPRKPCGNSFRD